MKAIEKENEDLKGVLDIEYSEIEDSVLIALLKQFSVIDFKYDDDIFGKIYEYFLGKFAMGEGQRGGEFFTPESLVKLIVDIIEPKNGLIYDPACGSGGMFVHSANYIKKLGKDPMNEISVYGQEKTLETVKLCKMNLAVHGISGDIKQGNSYYEDYHNSFHKFDFVMANPPFNVKGVNKEKIKGDPRYSIGIPRADNANFLWIQIFWNALKNGGRAGFVMPNSACDIQQSERKIRKKLIEDKAIDIIISISSNFFYNVTLTCTLCFLNKGKEETERKNTALFIDARKIYNQVDRAHRDFTQEQIEFIASIVRMYRKENLDILISKNKLTEKYFPNRIYQDIKGLCKVISFNEIREENYSLNPGRYVGIKKNEEIEIDFYDYIVELNEKLEELNIESKEIENSISEVILDLLRRYE